MIFWWAIKRENEGNYVVNLQPNLDKDTNTDKKSQRYKFLTKHYRARKLPGYKIEPQPYLQTKQAGCHMRWGPNLGATTATPPTGIALTEWL